MRHCPRGTMLQRVLRQVHSFIAMVAPCGRLLTNPMQVLPEASVPVEHLRTSREAAVQSCPSLAPTTLSMGALALLSMLAR
jgi:hypothetical protein